MSYAASVVSYSFLAQWKSIPIPQSVSPSDKQSTASSPFQQMISQSPQFVTLNRPTSVVPVVPFSRPVVPVVTFSRPVAPVVPFSRPVAPVVPFSRPVPLLSPLPLRCPCCLFSRPVVPSPVPLPLRLSLSPAPLPCCPVLLPRFPSSLRDWRWRPDPVSC